MLGTARRGQYLGGCGCDEEVEGGEPGKNRFKYGRVVCDSEKGCVWETIRIRVEKDNLLTTRFGRGGGVGDVLILQGKVSGLG